MWLLILIALVAGVANPLQAAANAQLNRQLHQALWAGAAVYASGFAGLLLALLVMRPAVPDSTTLARVESWAWMGGVISLLPTLAGALLAQRLGSGLFTGLTITAAMVTSLVIDQFGILGFQQHSATPARLIGCGLLIVGAWLVAFR